MHRERTPEQHTKLFRKLVFRHPKKWVQVAFRHAVHAAFDSPCPNVQFFSGLSLRLIRMVKEPIRSELIGHREDFYIS